MFIIMLLCSLFVGFSFPMSRIRFEQLQSNCELVYRKRFYSAHTRIAISGEKEILFVFWRQNVPYWVILNLSSPF